MGRAIFVAAAALALTTSACEQQALPRRSIEPTSQASATTLRAAQSTAKAPNGCAIALAATSGFDPVVPADSQSQLAGVTANTFRSYLERMHERIHPLFEDGYIAKQPDRGYADRGEMGATIEIVLDAQTGAVVSLGRVQATGVGKLATAAIAAVCDAAPFGKAPDIITSHDGKIYIHWRFHRDPFYACASKFARAAHPRGCIEDTARNRHPLTRHRTPRKRKRRLARSRQHLQRTSMEQRTQTRVGASILKLRAVHRRLRHPSGAKGREAALSASHSSRMCSYPHALQDAFVFECIERDQPWRLRDDLHCRQDALIAMS